MTRVIDGARCFQAMVPMRDGVRLNTFVFLPESGGPRYPVILQRTPYGITSPEGQHVTDCTKGWLPNPQDPLRGSLLRGWREIVRRGYAAVYQDTRGRYGSEGEDHVYGNDAADGYDTLEWVAGEPWSNHRVGLSGSSAGATTALAAASQCHPTVRAFFTQVGGSSIYEDVVYEGQSIELERLWLWVARNIPGLSPSHREAVMRRHGLSAEELAAVAASAHARYTALDAARQANPPFIGSADWMHLPLTGYPDFSVWQPYLDEIISHPAPDAFRARHNFRATISVPGFHVTTWFDIFLTSVVAAFTDIHSRVGNQRLWVGPNGHYFVYERNFWPRDPYFEWFDHWLKGEPTRIVEEPAVFYSPRAWVANPKHYVATDWRHAEHWPPSDTVQQRLYLTGDGYLSGDGPSGETRSYLYDPNHPLQDGGKAFVPFSVCVPSLTRVLSSLTLVMSSLTLVMSLLAQVVISLVQARGYIIARVSVPAWHALYAACPSQNMFTAEKANGQLPFYRHEQPRDTSASGASVVKSVLMTAQGRGRQRVAVGTQQQQRGG